MKTHLTKYLPLILRLMLGGIFLWAGTLKVLEPQQFADSIATFQVLPAQFINLLALSLPILEILLGLMLLIGVNVRSAAFGIAALNAVFILAIAQGLARGLEMDCGCFGSGEPSVWKSRLVFGRDILFLAIAAVLVKVYWTSNHILLPGRPRSTQPVPQSFQPVSD